MRNTNSRRVPALITVTAITALALAACASAEPAAAPEPSAAPDASASEPQEVAAPETRLAVAYDGGVLVLDADSLEVISELSLDEPVRLADAGDGRHVALTTETGIRMLDAGVWTDGHDGHAHSYAAEPSLTDIEFPMTSPGHVVAHGATTALFSDGDGTVTLFESADLADGQPATDVVTLADAHHGVAVALGDGTLVVTEGDDETRESVIALRDGDEIARTDECPRVHGEGAAANDRLVFGCAGGVVVYADGAFTRIDAPDADASIGTVKGSDASPIVVTNYAVEGDDAPRLALVDTVAMTVRVIDAPAAYASSGITMTDAGTALVLGTDGVLSEIEVETGAVVSSIPVVDAWTIPESYTEPRPTLASADGVVWVADPAAEEVHAIDLESGSVSVTAELPQAPRQLVVVRG